MRAFTIAQRPELIPEFVALDERSWPEFMHHGDIEITDDVFYSDFGEYQIAIVNESEQLVAAGQTLPFHWSGINEELPEYHECGDARCDCLPRGHRCDPWLRTHEQLGGKRLGLAPRAFSVIASVADWQRWAGISFEHTGAHVAPGAIVPVEINLEIGTGTYVEPSVWYLHSL